MTRRTELVVTDDAMPMYSRLTAHRGHPADKLFIFARTKDDADNWAVANGFNRAEYTHVNSHGQIRTTPTKPYPRVFVPGWTQHPQARIIAHTLTQRDGITTGWRQQ